MKIDPETEISKIIDEIATFTWKTQIDNDFRSGICYTPVFDSYRRKK